jgi:monovalent cation:H+ antiporter-2, CPA2 family
MNLETVGLLRKEGVPVVYGDASHRETLHSAGVERSASLILGASGIRAPQEIIRMAREMNPDIRVLVRSAYLRERAALLEAGADLVFSGEGEVALAMTESVLQGLGATPEQIDRERERLRQDFHRVGGERTRA